jgi:RNA polymerase sigma factor (sigma-70 family)
MGDAAPDHDRQGAAVALLESHGAVLRRIAQRYSDCCDDADDALQRASLILLTKGPAVDPGRLMAWMAVVTKHEAIAVRRSRSRLLGCLALEATGDRLDAIPSERPGPAERAERVEEMAEARASLAALKANERLAIVLQAQGYSYAEIGERLDWTYTKVNRCLAEGRARLCAAAGSP